MSHINAIHEKATYCRLHNSSAPKVSLLCRLYSLIYISICALVLTTYFKLSPSVHLPIIWMPRNTFYSFGRLDGFSFQVCPWPCTYSLYKNGCMDSVVSGYFYCFYYFLSLSVALSDFFCFGCKFFFFSRLCVSSRFCHSCHFHVCDIIIVVFIFDSKRFSFDTLQEHTSNRS